MGIIIQPSGQGDAQGDVLIRVNAEDNVGVHSFYLLTRQVFTAICDLKLIPRRDSGLEKNTPRAPAVSALGFEPRTNGLKGHCSAVELRARKSGVHSNMVDIQSQRKTPLHGNI